MYKDKTVTSASATPAHCISTRWLLPPSSAYSIGAHSGPSLAAVQVVTGMEPK
jgi:hypothetical protein